MNIFGFRPFKGKFNLGNSDDIPENQDGTLIGSIKQINASLTNIVKFKYAEIDVPVLNSVWSVVDVGSNKKIIAVSFVGETQQVPMTLQISNIGLVSDHHISIYFPAYSSSQRKVRYIYVDATS